MITKIMIIFALAQLVNVMLATVKSLFTINGGWIAAALSNSIMYGFYTYVIVLTANADFSTNTKAIITIFANLIGVAIVKLIERKMHKDKLWVYYATIKNDNANLKKIIDSLRELNIKCVYNEIVKDELYTMQIFSNTQKESIMIKGVLDNFDVKYHALESKDQN